MHSVVSVEEKLPVVVGVDGVPGGIQVVDVAAAEAAYRGVPLEIVHAWPGRRGGPARLRAARSGPDDGRHLLELAARRAGHVLPGVRVRTRLVDDSAAEALIQLSAHACLLVVGHRDEAGLGRGWGSTAAYVANHAHCPLLVYRGPNVSRGPVVVAASGRHAATVGCAYEAAARADCPLVAVHVWAPEDAGAGNGGDRHEAEDRLSGSLTVWAPTWPDVVVERLLISEADIGYTVERASRRGRLLVAGRGRKGWSVEMLYSIGSVSPGGRRLCPVLVVPPGWSGTDLVRSAPVSTARS
ncbi:universal stress protein [Actinoplanes sp. GCM10030250]|uniref:universal stress protein n=1 Tax=Actinoplanes sp. GCM10030250 TaxID=3273376 RepID=UPI00361D107E